MAKKFKSNLGSKRKTQSKVSAERVQWETRNRFNPIRNLSPTSLSSYMDAWERGEIGTLARVWDVMARRDLRLSGLIPKRLKKPARRDWNIVMLEDGNEAERQRDAVEHAFNHAMLKSAVDGDKCEGFAGIIRSMMQAVGMKYAVHELIWQPSPEGLTFEAVEVPLWFFERKSGKLRFLAQPHAQTGEDLEPGEWMTTVADGLMESSGVAYMFKSLPLKDILAYCDKFGVPGLVAKTDASPDTKEWEAVHEMVASFGSEMAAVVSRNGTELDFPTVKGGAGTTPMEALVDYIDRAMSSVWHGSDLSTMSRDNDAVGSLAQNAEADTLELDDCERISDTINKQLIGSILKYALGTDAILVKFELDVSDLEATGDELTVDKGLYKMGFKHSVNDLAERYGRKVPDDEEFVSKDGSVGVSPASKNPSPKDTALANIAGGDHHLNQSRDARGRFGATFVSPNVGEDMPIQETIRRGDSSEQGLSISLAQDIDNELNLTGKHYTAYGDWADGSENTVYGEYSGIKDFEEIEYAAAVRGLIHDQKAVIAFKADKNGADAMYIFENTNLSINEARQKLQQAGIENRTLVPTKAGLNIVIFDKGSILESKILELANETKTNINKIRGRGEFIGDWDQRSTGKQAYHRIIENYETKWSDRRHHRTGRNRRLRRSDGTDDKPTLSNEKRSPFKSWLTRLFFSNEKQTKETHESSINDARTALQKDFEPMAAEISAALNEKDPAFRKALLLKIAAADVPTSDEFTTTLTKAMAAVLIEGFSDVK